MIKQEILIERISIELTNLCDKGCWFCYNHSLPSGATQWTIGEVVDLVRDCAANGTKAVSLGGGEPLQFAGVFDVLKELDGLLFRSMTTNGLRLDQHFDELVEARPDKVHLSVHFPQNEKEVDRVIDQTHQLAHAGILSGINLLIAQSNIAAANTAAEKIRQSGIGNERIVYLPMRSNDTPTPREVAQVAGLKPFQSMTCLSNCGKSDRFCSVAWNKMAAWCSYTVSRRPLETLDFSGLVNALDGLGLEYCGTAKLEAIT
ncbi:MAG: radical SAM protein [Mariniblastus sp.]